MFYADLHIHSRYSRATSRDCDPEHLALWAQKKGLRLLGTGDFTHPAYRTELREKLIPAGPGVFELRPDLARDVAKCLPPACRGEVRFVLSVEIATIYKKLERTRKIHHVVCVPDFDAAEALSARLERIGNLHSDGRPILGLDSRDLLEIVLENAPGGFLIPAHIWTPWFAVLGSKSGFDSIEACYADLSPHIFALETGLSSDPEMNWRVSKLDRFRLVSHSDAHSPAKLGREACVFDTACDLFAVRRALEHGEGYVGTVEFFPEEGKYHLDGHRKCGVRLTPRETLQRDGLCPECGKPLTLGVMHRVEELSDRQDESVPASAGTVRSLVPLSEILGELHGKGPQTKTVQNAYETLLARLGPELAILGEIPLEEVSRHTSPMLGEALARLRRGEVIRDAGYDGEYGTIHLFQEHELPSRRKGELLFDLGPTLQPAKATTCDPAAAAKLVRGDPQQFAAAPAPVAASSQEAASAPVHASADLDDEQAAAVAVTSGALLIVAGPGSGKTRVLTYRLAHLIEHCGVRPESCLAVTFTRRAAAQMRERLSHLVPEHADRVPVHTFHSLGLSILKEHADKAGLPPDFRIADEQERRELVAQTAALSMRRAQRVVAEISKAKRTNTAPGEPSLAKQLHAYTQALAAARLVDFDDLTARSVTLLSQHAEVLAQLRARYEHVSIDEYQDLDAQQYRLVRLLVPPGGNVCAIGDPDQAIYAFRGADPRFFATFAQDFPKGRTIRLQRNYRSSRTIARASTAVVSVLDPQGQARVCQAMGARGARLAIHAAASEKAEAEFVVHTIERLLGGHSFFSLDSGRSDGVVAGELGFSDFAVLYRTQAQSAAVGAALRRSGMPHRQYSHKPLNEHAGVQAIRRTLASSKREGPTWELVSEAAAALMQAGGQPQSVTQEALDEALELLKPVCQRTPESLDELRCHLALGVEVDTWDERAECISLLTLHAAKGLEFPVVFIVGCEDGLLPLSSPGQAHSSCMEEERRLFYVGMTRAQRHLILCRAAKRLWRGAERSLPPSPFLAAIEERLLEHQKMPRRRRSRPEPPPQLSLF